MQAKPDKFSSRFKASQMTMEFIGRRIALMSFVLCIALGVAPLLPNLFWKGGAHNNQRLLEALCLSLVWGYIVLRYLCNDRSIIRISSTLAQYLCGFFLIGIFSGLNAYSPRFAFFEWSNFLLLILLAGLIAMEVKEGGEKLLDRVLLACACGCGLYISNVALIYIAAITSGGQPLPAEFIPGFDNYRFFNHVQTISLPMLVLLVLRSERYSKQYWFAFVATSLWWTLLFVSAGRGTFVGVFAGAAITLLVRRQFAIPWCRVLIVTCMIGAGVHALFFTVIPLSLDLAPFGFASQLIHRTAIDPVSGRGSLWRLGWELVVEHPFFGVGPAHFAHYGAPLNLAAHPHNWILQVASEWGLIALLCLFATIYQAFRSLLKSGRFIDREDVFSQGTLCAWLTIGFAVLVDGVVSGLIVMPMSQLWIALYLGCAWGWTTAVLPNDDAKRWSFQRRKVMSFFLLFVLALFWLGLYPEIVDLEVYREKSLSSQPFPKVFRPRIWDTGFF